MKFKDLVDDIVYCQIPCPTCGYAQAHGLDARVGVE